MSQPLVIRVAEACDRDVALAAPLFDAYRQFYDQPSDPELAREFLAARLWAEDSVVLLALAGSDAAEALGFAQIYPSWSSVAARPIWIANDLFVAPEARGRGVGRALLERSRLLAAEAGAQRLALETLVGNTGAQRLYESLGWRCENDTSRYYTLVLS
jgi:GNAT superfamily N-acetyltransferase